MAGRIEPLGVASLFAGQALLSLLRVFFLNPSRDYYQRELTEITGMRLFVIQTALKRLVAAGLIGRITRGNRTYYRVDPTNPIHRELKALLLKTVGLGDSLRACLRDVAGRIRVAFVYGSVARGEESPSSDVDLMIIGGLSGREIASRLAPLRRRLNREFNPSTYTAAEFKRKVDQKHPFIREVVRDPKVFLIGDASALKAVTGSGTSQSASTQPSRDARAPVGRRS